MQFYLMIWRPSNLSAAIFQAHYIYLYSKKQIGLHIYECAYITSFK
jgi:hypothetical protein